MEEVFFSHNAAIVRASFPVSMDSGMTMEEFRDASAGYLERGFALVILALAGPAILLFALINRIASHGPAFYSQIRVGKGGSLFPVYKLRTMVLEAEKKTGAILSWEGDPRITPLGRFLRKTHLDELPQLLNILRGEMSFIGPRPERPEFVRKFEDEVNRYTLRHKTRPGITGLAQICCGYHATAEEKLEYDLVFIRNKHSLRMIGFILYRTALKVLQRQ